MGKHKKNLIENEIVLYPKSMDISKRWYVEYYNPQKSIIERVWIARSLSKSERLSEFERIKCELLKNGTVEKRKAKIVDNYTPTSRASKRLKNLLTEKPHLKKKTKSSYKSKLKKFDEFCKEQGYESINQAVASEYLNYRRKKGLSVTTVNNDRRVLKSFVKEVPKSSISINKNSFDKTKLLRGDGGSGREYYKPAQKKQIKEYFEVHYPALWLACKFVYYCYVRNGNELINLRVSDLDLHLKRLKIHSDNSKNGYCEQVVIPRAFAAELEKIDFSIYPQDFYLIGKNGLPSSEKCSVDYWGKLHKKALDEMPFDRGGKKYSMYSWKNTGVVDSYLNGIGIKDLQAQLRHKHLETTYLYLRVMGLFDNANTFDKINPL